MKKIIALLLVTLMLGVLPVCASAAEESEEEPMIEKSFYEMAYSVPESWRIDMEDEATVNYVPYASGMNGNVMFAEQDIDLSEGDKQAWMDLIISMLYEEESSGIEDVSEIEAIEISGVPGLRASYTQDWNNGRADGWMYVFATDTKAYAISWVVVPSKSEELQTTMEKIIEDIQFVSETESYNTGITYEQLERTPDSYLLEKVTFTGTVLQVIESEEENQARILLDGSDDVLYIGYDPNILDFRMLEDDVITIYGQSVGLYTYETVLGSSVTLPAVYVDRIDFVE